jgi:hypothetical protein
MNWGTSICWVSIRISENADDLGPLTDLWTVFIGLGVLTANASIRETHSRVGRWVDWQIYRHGYLTMPMYGYALALLERIRDEDRPQWPRHLRPDVRHAFRRSLRYLDKVGLPKLHLVRTTSARPALVFPSRRTTMTSTPIQARRIPRTTRRFAPSAESPCRTSMPMVSVRNAESRSKKTRKNWNSRE